MKVVMLTRTLFPFHDYGGLEKFVYYLSKNLVREGVDVEIVTSSNKTETRKIGDFKYAFVPPLVGSNPNFPHLIRAAHLYLSYNLFNVSAAKYLAAKKFDILHSYEMAAQRYLHLEKRSPTIVQAFNNEVCKAPGFKKFLWKPAMLQLKDCMVQCDTIASEGEFQNQEIIELFGVDKKKIIIIPVGVDLTSVERELETKTLSRKELGFSDKDLVLISVNRITAVKGINHLVDAFSIIKSEHENAKLLLIGSGSEESRIEKQVHDLKLTESVLHLKNVRESLLFSYYSQADVYVSPTLQDDFLIGILEAMACGLPIVSTGQSFLVHSGINGHVVPKKNPKAIADAVLKMRDKGECKTMGNMSREIVKDYDWKVIAKKAIKEYERLI
jgi:glycosyltransferase involved in cell wall biosynthesis